MKYLIIIITLLGTFSTEFYADTLLVYTEKQNMLRVHANYVTVENYTDNTTIEYVYFSIPECQLTPIFSVAPQTTVTNEFYLEPYCGAQAECIDTTCTITHEGSRVRVDCTEFPMQGQAAVFMLAFVQEQSFEVTYGNYTRVEIETEEGESIVNYVTGPKCFNKAKSILH